MKGKKIHLQLKTDTPLIGSGKISRYYIVKRPKERKVFNSLKLQKRVDLKRECKIKQEVDFKNNKVKLIFLHWNTKGKPFTIHKLKRGITVSSGINKAYHASKKYSFKDIREAIDLCHNMFNSSWFKFTTKKVGIGHLTLSDFFKYSNEKRNEIRTRYKQLAEERVISWFKESLKGEDYLQEKYSLHFKDSNNLLTKKVLALWLAYSGHQKIKANDKNALIICSRKAVEFARLNEQLGVSAEGVIMTIDNMLNKFHLYKPKHIGWLITEHFWTHEIPHELVRYGTVIEIDKNKIRLLSWDKK